MKRRTFLILGGMTLAGNLCGRLSQLTPTAPVRLPDPDTPPPSGTPFQPQTTRVDAAQASADGSTLVEAAATQTPLPEPTQTLTPIPPAANWVDEFDDPVPPATRIIQADSAGQISIADGRLRVRGVAPGMNNPAVLDTRPILRGDGQMAGARFQVDFGRETGRIGLVSTDGQTLASIRRSAAEGLGGTLECGAAVYPVLNLYSGCWYDFAVFLKPGLTAFAVNDGAGLEVALISDEDRSSPGCLGYWAGGGEDQSASLDAWYAAGTTFFPPELVSTTAAPVDYEADIATNSAWVEARITRAGGNAGLRIRSIDQNNEYRVYLDGEKLKLDQVADGIMDTVTIQEMADTPGAKLAVRYNELTLTIYYNGMVTKAINRKIGAAGLIGATKIGTYSTDPANQFTDLRAWAVRLEVPADINSRLLDSRRVLCLGDSLTNGDKAFGYQNGLRKSLGDAWVTVDAGVSGQTTYQMLSRLPGHLDRYHPEVVVVLGGTNDLDRDYPEGMITGNLQAIYRTARQAGGRVAAVSLPPFAGYKNWTEEKQARLERVNGWIMGSAQAVDFRISAYHLLKDPQGNGLLPAYDSGDHLHLSGSGYDTLANAIFRKITW